MTSFLEVVAFALIFIVGVCIGLLFGFRDSLRTLKECHNDYMEYTKSSDELHSALTEQLTYYKDYTTLLNDHISKLTDYNEELKEAYKLVTGVEEFE